MLRRSSWLAIQLAFLAVFVVTSPAAGAATIISAIQATNVVDTSFSVSWVTSQTGGSGSVCEGVTAASVTRCVTESALPSGAHGDVHNALVTGLSASTTYYFDVTVSSSVGDNGGVPYTVKTGPTLPTPTATYAATGKVMVTQTNGSTIPAPGVIVFVKITDNTGSSGQPAGSTSDVLSAQTLSDGSWSIPLKTRSSDSTATFLIPSTGVNDILNYSVEGGGWGDINFLSIPMTVTANQAAVPTITLIQTNATSTPSSTATPLPTASSTPVPPQASPTFTVEIPSPTPVPATPTPVPTEPAVAPAAAATPVPAPQPPAPVQPAPTIEQPTEPPAPPVAADAATATPGQPAVAPPSSQSAVVATASTVPSQAPPATLTPVAAPTLAPPPPPVIPAIGFQGSPVSTIVVPSPVGATGLVTPGADVSTPGTLPPDETLGRATTILLVSLAIIIAGVVLVAVGIARQSGQS